MLWYKAWLDTRWRFLIGLALLSCSAAMVVLTYPQVRALMPTLPTVEATGEIGRRIHEAAVLMQTYPGYVWSQWFAQNPVQMGTLFAALLGCGGLLSPGANGTLFTLSLPASRHQLLGIRAAAGFLEIGALALIPSLTISLFSPAVDQRFGLGSAVAYSLCLFAGMALFFSLAMLFSTVFGDVWRPLLVTLAIAVGIGLAEAATRTRFGVFSVMNGERYFSSGQMPWLGLVVLAALSAALMYGARLNFARKDF